MTHAWWAFAGTVVMSMTTGFLAGRLVRLAAANCNLTRDNDRLSNQLDTYRIHLGDPARLNDTLDSTEGDPDVQ